MYVIPFSALQHLFRDDAGSVLIHSTPNGSLRKIEIPLVLFRALLQASLASQDFDEDKYLSVNPDVASAVRRGEIASGKVHYMVDGYFEGRANPNDLFDEAWYLRANPDVAQSVRMGSFPSGKSHFETVGIYEGRLPHAHSQTDMALWSTLIHKSRLNKPRVIQSDSNSGFSENAGGTPNGAAQ